MKPGTQEQRKMSCQAWTQVCSCAGSNHVLICANVADAASTPFFSAAASTVPFASPMK